MMDIIRPGTILLPEGVDMTRWSVIACDQFTSQREYWDAAEKLVGDAPSTLRLMLPEARLGDPDAEKAPERITKTMERYLAEGVFTELRDSCVYVERRQADGRKRRGLLGLLDLEAYDFSPDSRTPVRATEATVEERLPARIRIRSASPLEMPHVLMLMDDRDDRVLSPLEQRAGELKTLYDFELMLGGGHLAGRQVSGALLEDALAALGSLGSREEQCEKYGEAAANGPIVLAVGDGNHSLAAAKRIWESIRDGLSPSEREIHPARFALVETVNIHDPALDFSPIHRVLFETDDRAFAALSERERSLWESPERTPGERVAAADRFCADYISRFGGRVDYVHDLETARRLGSAPGCAALLLPPISKEELFSSVLRSGPLPKKTFSMGQARDKRYYLECRRIK